MTKKQEILKELKKELQSPHSTVGLMLNSTLAFPVKGETAGSMKEKLVPHILDWLSSALDRYALSVVEASVPGEKDVQLGIDFTDTEKDAWNSCRAQTLENARRLVAGGEKTIKHEIYQSQKGRVVD